MWNKIVNPKSGRLVNINGKIGFEILKKYLLKLKGGSWGAAVRDNWDGKPVGASLEEKKKQQQDLEKADLQEGRVVYSPEPGSWNSPIILARLNLIFRTMNNLFESKESSMWCVTGSLAVYLWSHKKKIFNVIQESDLPDDIDLLISSDKKLVGDIPNSLNEQIRHLDTTRVQPTSQSRNPHSEVIDKVINRKIDFLYESDIGDIVTLDVTINNIVFSDIPVHSLNKLKELYKERLWKGGYCKLGLIAYMLLE